MFGVADRAGILSQQCTCQFHNKINPVRTMVFTPAGVPLLHSDHGLGLGHLELCDNIIASKKGFFIAHVDIPEHLPGLPSALYGPACGDLAITDDEVVFERRAGRDHPSRLIERPNRMVRKMVVIGVGGLKPRIFTAYGGQIVTPKEPINARNDKEKQKCIQFWKVHALARS